MKSNMSTYANVVNNRQGFFGIAVAVIGITAILLAGTVIAAGSYTIDGSSSLTDTILTLNGTSGANPQTGADNTQHMAVDWDEDQDGDPTTGTGWEVAPAGGLTFSPSFFNNDANKKSFDATWSAEHDYAGLGGGTYTVRVMVYHGNTPGQDGDAQNIVTFEVYIPVNNVPVAVDDPDYVTDENTLLEVVAPGVLGNDTDGDSDPLEAVLASDVSNGTLTLNADGSFSYTPSNGFGGVDTFTYYATDGEDNSNVATATITVNSVNSLPVITLTGDASVEVVLGGSYSESGATADDEEDGNDLEVTDIDASEVDTTAVGTYTVYYNFTDSDGGVAEEVAREVTVVYGTDACNDGIDNDGDGNTDYPADSGCDSYNDNDENTPPAITLTGSAEVNYTIGDTYSEDGATADDEEDGNGLEVTDIDPSAVNMNLAGSYTVYYNFTDSDGAAADEVTRTVVVAAGSNECNDDIDNDGDELTDIDDPGCHTDGDAGNPESYNPNRNENSLPVITLTGSSTVEVVLGGSYSEDGATADDVEDGNNLEVTDIDASEVDVTTVGTYTVYYNFTDSDGAAADEVTRTVEVVYGTNECNDGVSNDDDEAVDYPNDAGCDSYEDDDENATPEITLTGSGTTTLTVGDTYSEDGATADDEEDGSGLTVTSIDASDVDTTTPGTYYVYYNFTDSDGADAVEVVRTVEVVAGTAECNDGQDNDGDESTDINDPSCHSDGNPENPESYNPNRSENSIPVITLTGNSIINLFKGDSYSEYGATADDEEDGNDLPVTDIDASGVDTSTIGTYKVYYNFTDSDGADAVEVTRTVNVQKKPSVPTPPSGGGGGGGGGVTFGCTDETASNFSSIAVLDDGSCKYATQGEVLGASIDTTSTPVVTTGEVLGESCEPLIYSYIKLGKNNDPEDVRKLQQFLNDTINAGLPVTGFYGPLTFAAVEKFQKTYWEEVLLPWVPYGLATPTTSTGYVYKTTKRWVNMLYCRELEIPMPDLSEE